MKYRNILRKSLAASLSLQLFMGSLWPARSSFSAGSDLGNSISGVEIVKAKIDAVNSYADLIEAGTPPAPIDAFHLSQQTIEIFNRLGGNHAAEVFNLSQFHSSLPNVSFASLEVELNPRTGSLSFIAIAKGQKIARHTIENLDVVAFAKDAELLMAIDSNGRLHAMDMNYVRESVFKNPLPVFKNLHTPLESISLDTGNAEFLTNETEIASVKKSSLVPVDQDGNLAMKAGDLVVSNQSELVGVYSRAITYELVRQGTATLAWLATIVSPEKISGRLAKKAHDAFKENLEGPQIQPKTNREIKIDAETQNALAGFNNPDVRKLLERITHARDLEKREFQQFPLKSWLSGFLSLTDISTPSIENLPDPRSMGEKILTSKSLKILGALAACISSTSLYQHGLSGDAPLQVVHAINWIQAQIDFPVLKDAVYRIPLLKSTLSMVLFIPTMWLVSLISVPTLENFSKAIGKFSPETEVSINEKLAPWKNLTPWQRIVSAGVRVFAQLMYPFWNTLIVSILKQRSFIKAISYGVNPFEKITPESETGKNLNLDKPIRVGINSPFDEGSTQAKALSQTVQNKLRMESLAWWMATVVVCEKYGIDPATLLQVQKGLAIENLGLIFNDTKKRSEWNLLRNQIKKFLSNMPKGRDLKVAIENLNPDRIEFYHNIATTIAQKIDSQNRLKTITQKLLLGFNQKFSKGGRATLSFGTAEYQFLNSLYSNQFVTSQVKKEFMSDHIFLTSFSGLKGRRANTDAPSDLAANAEGPLWTNPEHLFTYLENMMVHFFIASSRLALIYQENPKKAETNYLPKGIGTEPVREKTEGLLAGSYHWAKNLFDVRKADLGGIFVQEFTKRFAVIQATIVLSTVFRVLIADQPVPMAMKAMYLTVTAALWWYSAMFPPVQRANQMYEEDFKERNKKLADARIKLCQSECLFDLEPTQRDRIIEGYTEIFEMYEEFSRSRTIGDLKRGVRAAEQKFLGDSLRPEERFPLEAVSEVFSENGKHLFGLLAALRMAQLSNDPDRVKEIYSRLLRSNGLTAEEVAFTAPFVNDYIRIRPPAPTRPNPLVSWTAISAAVISSTFLILDFSVASFDETYLTMETLFRWTGISAASFLGTYLLLSPEPRDKAKKVLTNLKESSLKGCRSLFGKIGL